MLQQCEDVVCQRRRVSVASKREWRQVCMSELGEVGVRRKNRHWLESLGEPRLEVVRRGRVKNHGDLLSPKQIG